MTTKSKRIQSANYFCVSYLTLEQINDVLSRKSPQIKHYAYILHDRDVESDGSLKQPHYHILVQLVHNVNETTFRNWWKGYFDEKQMPVNTLVRLAGDVTACYRYLTHKDDPDKYQYSETLITATDPSHFESEVDANADNVWNYVEMILNGVSLREVAKIGGRDFIYHYSAIRAIVDDILKQERKEFERHLREQSENDRIERIERENAFMRGEDVTI